MARGDLDHMSGADLAGFFEDGGIDIFFSARVPAGEHRLSLAMNDSVRADGFNHRLDRRVAFAPARVLLVSFDASRGFVLGGAEGRAR